MNILKRKKKEKNPFTEVKEKAQEVLENPFEAAKKEVGRLSFKRLIRIAAYIVLAYYGLAALMSFLYNNTFQTVMYLVTDYFIVSYLRVTR